MTQAAYAIGNSVGTVAQKIYDPEGQGEVIDAQRDGYQHAYERTRSLLQQGRPIFEAGFQIPGAMAFADVMRRSPSGTGWEMIEVKASTTVKEYHRDDIAVQAHICRSSGVALNRVFLAHVDRDFEYQGDGDYTGLLFENDLTEEAFGRSDEVTSWIQSAQAVVGLEHEPDTCPGSQCTNPFDCGFIGHCNSGLPQAEFPISVLPSVRTKALKEAIFDHGASDLRQVDDALLNERQARVKEATLTGKVYFDQLGAQADLQRLDWPLLFLDFETVQLAVPIWAGHRPYDQVPFQFSLHVVLSNGEVQHLDFLDLTGHDPARSFAKALIRACGSQGSVVVYNASFESTRIKELAQRFPDLADPLQGIRARLFDLLKVVEARYYHPDQKGSWSIKKVLPTIAPDLQYSDLDGVQSGSMVTDAYFEAALNPDTPRTRKSEMERQLRDYCRLDTWAMVRVWQYLVGSQIYRGNHGTQ